MQELATAKAQRQSGALEIRGVEKHFQEVHVLRGVSLSVAAGSFVTLLGPSGCGKTTLLRILAGLELPDRGTVTLSGRDITHLPAPQRRVNTVFQSYALFPHLSVADNVAFGVRARKLPESEVKARVPPALEMLRLSSLAHRLPAQLSGGQRQRVALARAIVNEPELLLLDEPLSALDAQLRADVQVELVRLQRRLGTTFVMVTHDQDEAMAVSDHLFLMREGTIIQSGPPRSLYEQPASRFVAEFLGTANLLEARPVSGGFETRLGHLVGQGEATELCIRPEHIQLSHTPPATNGVRARVREVSYRGDHCEVWLEPDLRVRVFGKVPAPGEEIWAHLPGEYLIPLRPEVIGG